jgi:trimeric autotransporter adhesin
VKSGKLKSKWYQGILLLVVAMAFAAASPEAQSQAVHGSGTTNRVPLWINSSTLSNSALSQSGLNLTTSGSITALSFVGDGSALSNVNAAQLGGIPPSGFAQLGAASNTFTGSISASTVNSTNPYQINGTNVLSMAGSNNLFVGPSAGASNTFSGTGNTASGSQAFYNNTTGFSNTASGYQALFSNTTGGANTASGSRALFSNTTGNFNTASGLNAGFFLQSGNSNIMVGFQAGAKLRSNESNNIDIGNEGLTGDGTFTTGVIRIGTDFSQDPSCNIGCQTATYIAAISGTPVSAGSPVLVDTYGQLGTIPSSRRYKEDIHDMGAASDGLLRLRPVTFRYKKPYADGSKPIQYGLVAEEVADVYPDLVVRGKDGQVETVQYYKLDAMLLNEVQKLDKLHAADQAEIAQLQSQIAEQRKLGKEQLAAMRQLLNQVHSIQVKLESSRSARSHRPVARATAHQATKPRVARHRPA